MERLGRYPLSYILSFLNETDGTCFLITRKRYANQVLPIFRLRQQHTDALMVIGSTKKSIKNRHKFAIVPAQDPTVLLARLNTRRLHERRRRLMEKRCDEDDGHKQLVLAGLGTDQLAKLECQRDEDNGDWIPRCTPCLMRFLDSNEKVQQQQFYPWQRLLKQQQGPVLLVSYPRSGNTLVRSLLEKTTGLVTGSDTRPSRNLSRELAEQHDLVGEGCCLSSNNQTGVFFVKSHWPERTGCAAFDIPRVIVIVRNPYDAMDSYWNMNATCSHTQTVSDAVYEQFQEFYHGLIRNEIQVWMKFHHYWLGGGNHHSQDTNNTRIPSLVVRFEDLIVQPAVELQKMLRFSLQTETLSQAWQDRIHQVVTSHTSIDGLGSYQPRTVASEGSDLPCLDTSESKATSLTTTTPRTKSNGATEQVQRHLTTSSARQKIGKSIHKGRFSSDLLQEIHDTASSYSVNYLQQFGYDVHQQGFPYNFNDTPPPCNSNTRSPPSTLVQQQSNDGVTRRVRVNEGNVIRPLDCPYGRKLTAWRHSVTNSDRNPLPVIPKQQ